MASNIYESTVQSTFFVPKLNTHCSKICYNTGKLGLRLWVQMLMFWLMSIQVCHYFDQQYWVLRQPIVKILSWPAVAHILWKIQETDAAQYACSKPFENNCGTTNTRVTTRSSVISREESCKCSDWLGLPTVTLISLAPQLINLH